MEVREWKGKKRIIREKVTKEKYRKKVIYDKNCSRYIKTMVTLSNPFLLPLLQVPLPAPKSITKDDRSYPHQTPHPPPSPQPPPSKENPP